MNFVAEILSQRIGYEMSLLINPVMDIRIHEPLKSSAAPYVEEDDTLKHQTQIKKPIDLQSTQQEANKHCIWRSLKLPGR